MSANLLVASNPRGRKRRMSAKQRAAALRNLRKARRARGGGKRRRRNPVGMYLTGNPKRRKRRASSFVRRLRRRRNPGLKLSPRGLMAKAMPALIGGGGAVANDLLYNFALGAVPATVAPELVSNLRTGPLRHVGKAVSALLLSTVAGFVLPRRIAEQMGTGALVVVGYNVVRDAVAKFAPNVAMGMYLNDGSQGMGWAGAGWNPNYGRDWSTATRSGGGMGAFLRSGGGAGGGLTTGPQFKTAAPFTSRAAVYADELEQ